MSIKPEPSIIFKYSIEHIAKYFKVIRLAFGCSLDEIAANLGYTRHTVSKYEDPTYVWKPHDYYALRCMLVLLAFSIQDTEYYLEIWFRLIEGMTYKDGICVSEKYIDTYISGGSDEAILIAKDSYNKCVAAIHKEMLNVITDESKLQSYLDYFKSLLINAGYHVILCYWIDDYTIGILKDDFTKNIKDLNKFAKDNIFIDAKYVLVNENQIPSKAKRYRAWVRYNPTVDEEKYYQEIKKASQNDMKKYRPRYYFRFGF